MDSFVYRWTNTTLRKIYIGWHKGSEDDGYICSSASEKFWKDFKNPDYKWKREILFKGTMPECQLFESQLLDNVDITSDAIYNNKNNLRFNLNDEVRAKLRSAAIERGKNPEYRKAQAVRTKIQWATNPERRRLQSEKAKQQIMTDEIKEKIRHARSKQVITKESRVKSATTIKNAPDVKCPHCGSTGRYLGSMKKKHFNNCIHKPGLK
jgi:DNA-directed RNA polymerase subunit M/transcription elongation factor TFIIS